MTSTDVSDIHGEPVMRENTPEACQMLARPLAHRILTAGSVFDITGEIRVLAVPNCLLWRNVKSGLNL